MYDKVTDRGGESRNKRHVAHEEATTTAEVHWNREVNIENNHHTPR